MIVDFVGCYVIHATTKYLFASLEPAEIITRGRERREARRIEQAKAELAQAQKATPVDGKVAEKVVAVNGDVKQRPKKKVH
jgi:cation-transporting ATPase 13A1